MSKINTIKMFEEENGQYSTKYRPLTKEERKYLKIALKRAKTRKSDRIGEKDE